MVYFEGARKQPSLEGKGKGERQRIREAQEALERLAKNLDDLWQKESLTPEEQKRVDLILNNALVITDILEGRQPPEITTDNR